MLIVNWLRLVYAALESALDLLKGLGLSSWDGLGMNLGDIAINGKIYVKMFWCW